MVNPPTLRHAANLMVLVLAVAHPSFAETHFNTSARAVQTRLRSDVEYLASDELEGRGLTTKGLVLASEHIMKSYQEAGLKTNVVNGGPYFVFNSRVRLTVSKNSSLTLSKPNGDSVELKLGQDFTPISIGAAGDFDGDVVLAGYGITDTENDYDDFGSMDVKGKVVVLLRREPQQDDAKSPFAGKAPSQHAYLVRKLQNAANHGAVAVVLCNDEFSLRKDGKPDALMPFSVKARLATRPIPMVHMTRAAVAEMVGEPTLSEVERAIDRDLKPRSRGLNGWRVQGKAVMERKGDALRNVLGLIEPDDGADETVIVGAHYDHLGRGGSGSLAPWTRDIHNGADDNASGTSVLLEVARQVAARRGELKRRVLFIAFSAEESGLIGSARYCRAPIFPHSETAAMVNLDMVGRLRKEKLTVYGTGTGVGFSEMVQGAAKPYGMEVKEIPAGGGPSDHASFNSVGVPVLHIFTGLHTNYHRPSDDPETLNYDGMTRIAQMTVDVVMELASSTSQTRPKKTKKAKTNAKPATNTLKPGTAMLGASIVDGDDGGCRVTSLLKDGPAERAGLRVGDLIQKWNDDEMTNVKTLQSRIAQQNGNDAVKLTVLRESISLTLTVTLGEAP